MPIRVKGERSNPLQKWRNIEHSEIFAEYKGKRLCYGHSQEGQHTGLRASGPIQILKLTYKSLQILYQKIEWVTVIENDDTIVKVKTIDCGYAKVRDWHAMDKIIDENTKIYGTWYDS